MVFMSRLLAYGPESAVSSGAEPGMAHACCSPDAIGKEDRAVRQFTSAIKNFNETIAAHYE
jgi:hypothetical protein